MKRLFFYGTLRQEGWNHARFFSDPSAIRLVGNTTIDGYGITVDTDTGLPYMSKIPGAVAVGEIWEISDAYFGIINRMELQAGYDQQTTVAAVNGTPTTVLFYALNSTPEGSRFKFLPDGDYIAWYKRQRRTKQGRYVALDAE